MTHLPLHDLHARLGARFGEVDGCPVPLDYGDPAAEHEAVRERVGAIDRSGRGLVEVTGRDRVGFLQGMLSNDVKALGPGQGCQAAFLDHHGKLVSILVVHCLTDRILLEMDRSLLAPTLAALDRFLISERVELEDQSDAWGLVTLAGPAARKTVETLAGEAVPELAVWHHVALAWEGHSGRLVRDPDTGEEAYDVWLPVAAVAAFWERAHRAGVTPVGALAWDTLRVETGVVRYGVDVDASTLLLEASLPEAYSLEKGCYIGQEVVARITYRGHVNRKVVGFVFPDRRIPAPGATASVDGREVGRITSPVVSPTLGRGVALGLLRREFWAPGTTVLVAAEGGELATQVAELPFYRRSAPAA
jgi:aminomethyltransferase